METEKLIEIIFQALFGLIGTYIAFTFKQVSNDFKDLQKIVQELNLKLAVMCERVETHEGRIGRLEED